MAHPADDRAAALSLQETQTLDRLEASRQELAALREELGCVRQVVQAQTATLAAQRYEHEEHVNRQQCKLDKQAARFVRLWQLFKRRIRAERAAEHARFGELATGLDEQRQQVDAERARLDMRAIVLARREQRLERRTLAQVRQIKLAGTVATEVVEHTRQLDNLREEIAGLDARAQRLRELSFAPSQSENAPIITTVNHNTADDLADLRRRLVEHWQALLAACGTWLARQQSAALALAEAEQQIEQRCVLVAAAHAEALAQHWALDRQRETLAARERRVIQRSAALGNLYRLWSVRLREEQQALALARGEAEAAHDRWADLTGVDLRRRFEVHRRELAVTAREIAVERLRQESVEVADDGAAAERRIAKLEHQWQKQTVADEREFARQHDRLSKEQESLEIRENHVAERETKLLRRAEQLLAGLAEWERAQVSGARQAIVLAELRDEESKPAA